MTNIIPIHPAQAQQVEVDDSRLQSLWTRHHRRNMLLAGGAVVTGLLLGAAVLIMALRMNNEPPKVEITNAPPTITVPAPIVNLTVPGGTIQAPSSPEQKMREGETKLVTEHVVFHTATVNGKRVMTGWYYHSSNDKAPYHTNCYVQTTRTDLLDIGDDGKLSPTIGDDARKIGLDVGEAMTLAKSCRWQEIELRDPATQK